MLQLSSLLCGRHGNFQSPSSPYAAAAAHRQVKPKPGLKYTNAVFQFNKNKRNWKRRKHWNASVEQAFTWLLRFIGQLQCRWPLQCHWAECRDFSSSLPCKAARMLAPPLPKAQVATVLSDRIDFQKFRYKRALEQAKTGTDMQRSDTAVILRGYLTKLLGMLFSDRRCFVLLIDLCLECLGTAFCI